MHTLQKYQSLLESNSLDSIQSNLIKISQSLGFETVAFVAAPNQNVRMLHSLFIGNLAKGFVVDYEREQFHQINPLIPYCYRHSIPLLFKPETYNQIRQKSLYNCANDYKMKSGITYPIHGPNGAVGAIAFLSVLPQSEKSLKTIQQAMLMLSLIKDLTFQAALQFIPNESSLNDSEKFLSSYEMECLKWSMVGKSSWEISMITGKAENTVNYHINNIMGKLDVSTRQHAIIKAIKLGLIELG